MEHCLHWLYTVAIPDHTAQTVAREILKYFPLYVMCDIILTGLDTEFTSKLFKLALKYFDIKHLHTTVTHPQTNAMVERYYR